MMKVRTKPKAIESPPKPRVLSGGRDDGPPKGRAGRSPRRKERALRAREAQQRCILVVEDNPADAKLLRLVLSLAGFEVRSAVDAEEALLVLESYRPSLVVLDLDLPKIDGLALARRLKSDPRTRDLILLAVTATNNDREAIEAGCAARIQKPIDTDDFPALVGKLLQAK